MATATKRSPAPRRRARRALDEHPASSTAFLISEDNGGSYHWTLLAGDGTTLGRSGDFASYHDAEQAAQQVRDGAASARFRRREPGTGSVDPAVRQDAPDNDAAADRWLGEGGSVGSEAVAQ
jgi:uncharacterized protein YegP (UPF0339 family)